MTAVSTASAVSGSAAQTTKGVSSDRLLTVPQVGGRLQMPETSVRAAIRRKELAAANVGTRLRPIYRISEQQLADYLKARSTAA